MIESPEINPHTFGRLRGKNMKWRKTISSISGAWKTGQLHVRDETRTFFNTIYKNKLKMD